MFIADLQYVTGGLALGMEAEMIFGMRRMRYTRTCMGGRRGVSHTPNGNGCQNHCSGQPDGAADL